MYTGSTAGHINVMRLDYLIGTGPDRPCEQTRLVPDHRNYSSLTPIVLLAFSLQSHKRLHIFNPLSLQS